MRRSLRSYLARKRKTSGDGESAVEQRIKLLTALVILVTAAMRLAEVIWMMWSGKAAQ